ncbi:DeoR/GlpR family DNA-binding transcription regulator [Celeribacter litoreus]|uniref:DeoR/GlpR family DNA-binding transcription regulator n=1 Tax=Celeribacter litoreus TaxID=2876714 RepID=UPI001CCDE224|nr:DeoR/GlpR family DNA-binding transcription regulator [Celeribacter litoreus]MCA0044918.1 DeoR/GlpR family DNA-binding transcription regulator [Celeribacter litoreus]
MSDELLPAERRQHLMDWFANNHSGSSQDLARLFGISVSTIRRDLDLLASEGLVKRTHGGAVAVRSRATWEPSTDLARRTAVEEKQAIVLEAIKFIEPGQSLLIDTGAVVCHLLADEIAKLTIPLTVITNDLYVANTLTYKENIALHVPGGACRFGSFSLLGSPGEDFLKDIRCDIFFMSAAAVDETCVSETIIEMVQLKRAMVDAAREVILLADSSRFMERALHRTVAIDRINTIITDEGLSEESRHRFPSPQPAFRIASMEKGAANGSDVT